MDDFKPFLQIVHISDLHVIDPKAPTAVYARNSIRKARNYLPASIIELIKDGIAPHDRRAVRLFKDFLLEITAKDPHWSLCKTWLVDTGDLTSLGDQDSLNLGRKLLDDLAKVCPDLASIYGNHDAWPGKLPAWATTSEVAEQQKILTTLKYSIGAPGLVLKTAIPNGTGEVQLYFVDSISHNRWRNLWALGEVSDPQLKALQTLVEENYESGRNDFRILAVHHPVHYPPPRPQFQMSMTNDTNVASMLDTPSANGAYPLAHLILSGHTHFLYPDHGNLPSQPSLCLHPDLGDDQCQFIVGTLMQLDKYNKRGGFPHQCEVLRLYYSTSDPSIVLVDRLLAARQADPDSRGEGMGSYQFVRLPDKIEEEIVFTL